MPFRVTLLRVSWGGLEEVTDLAGLVKGVSAAVGASSEESAIVMWLMKNELECTYDSELLLVARHFFG